MRAVRSALDPVAVRSDLDKMLVEKGEEVRDRLADFAAGRYDFDGIRWDDVDRIQVVVVVVEPLFTQIGLDADTRKRLNVKASPKVDGFHIVDLESLEALASAIFHGALLSAILTKKAASPTTIDLLMKDYLVTRGDDLSPTPLQAARLQRVMSAVLAEATATGIPPI